MLFYHSFWRRSSLDPALWRHLVPIGATSGPPGAPMTPGMSSWAIVSHPGSLFDPSGLNNSSFYTTVPAHHHHHHDIVLTTLICLECKLHLDSGERCNVVHQRSTVHLQCIHINASWVFKCSTVFGIWAEAASICALGTSLCLRTCLLLPPDCHRGSHKTFSPENPCHLPGSQSLWSRPSMNGGRHQLLS